MHTSSKLVSSLLATAILLSTLSGIAFADSSARTLTMDTRSYTMAPGNIYDFKAVVSGPGLNQSDVAVSDSRNGSIVKLKNLGNGKYRITAVNEGTTYVIAQINGVHASIQVTVKKGVKQGGVATRSVSIIGNGTSYSSGMYKVGTEIPAGEYILIPTGSDSAYFEISSSSDGKFESIIANDYFSGRTIVTVSNGQYFNVAKAKIYGIDKAPAIDKSAGYLLDGMYRIGIDIPAGEYTIEPTETYGGYYEIASDSSHLLDSILGNGSVDNKQYLTVSNGQYLTLSGVKLILK